MTMSITEALAEIKLIQNKLQKKQQWVLQNLTKARHTTDPFASTGGIQKAAQAELQAIADLEKRMLIIRKAIMQSNVLTEATVLDKTQTIYEWLVWKKEIAKQSALFSQTIYTHTKSALDKIAHTPQAAKVEDNKTILVELDANTDYMKASVDAAYIQEILDKLDGVLSFKNATTQVEF